MSNVSTRYVMRREDLAWSDDTFHVVTDEQVEDILNGKTVLNYFEVLLDVKDHVIITFDLERIPFKSY